MSETQKLNQSDSQNIIDEDNIIKSESNASEIISETLFKDNKKTQNIKIITDIMIGYLKIDDVIKQKQEQINKLLYDIYKLNAEKSKLENSLVEYLVNENGDFIQIGDGSRLSINVENINDIVIKSLRREKHNVENK